MYPSSRRLKASAARNVRLIDARKGIDEEAETILAKLGELRQPKALVLNKVDLVDKPALLALAQAVNEKAKFDASFMVSALTGDGIDALKTWLAEHSPK